MFYVAEVRPIVEYGLTEHLGIEAQLPLKLTATTVKYRRLSGDVFSPDYVNIHHRDETLIGIGDPELSGRGRWQLGDLRVSGRLGMSLPLGKTEENPFALGRSGHAHQHIQFGTGTLNPLFALEGDYPVGAFHLRGNVRGQLVLGENAKGFRAGNRYAVGLQGERSVGKTSVAAGIDIVNEQPERWDGVVEQDGNLGRTDYLAGVSVTFPLGGFSVHAGVSIPFYQRIIESEHHDAGQLTYPALVQLSISRTFNLRAR